MYNILQIQNFQTTLNNLITNSDLNIVELYWIIKNLYTEINFLYHQEYEKVLSDHIDKQSEKICDNLVEEENIQNIEIKETGQDSSKE